MVLQGDLTSTSGRLAISLSTGWLNRVGVRGLACVDGCFILEVDQAAPATALMGQAVRWERRAGDHSVPVVAPCFIARRGGRWCLSW